MGRIPKRSDQLHGHRKPPKGTRIPASPRWIDEDGNLVYATAEPPDIPYDVKLPPGIEFEPDPDEEG